MQNFIFKRSIPRFVFLNSWHSRKIIIPSYWLWKSHKPSQPFPVSCWINQISQWGINSCFVWILTYNKYAVYIYFWPCSFSSHVLASRANMLGKASDPQKNSPHLCLIYSPNVRWTTTTTKQYLHILAQLSFYRNSCHLWINRSCDLLTVKTIRWTETQWTNGWDCLDDVYLCPQDIRLIGYWIKEWDDQVKTNHWEIKHFSHTKSTLDFSPTI